MIADGRRRRDAAHAGHGGFAGMLGVTLFGIFLTPVFYYVVRWLTERKEVKAPLAHGSERERPQPE